MTKLSLQGWIIYNGNLPGEKFRDFAEWLHKTAKQKDIQTTIYKNNEILAHLTGNHYDLIQQKNSLPDFVLFMDKDIYLAKQLELLGVPVFNSARAIEISDDKIATYQVLAEHQLTIPNTIIAPKVFQNHSDINTDFFKNVINILGFPMIIKEAFGSFGEQVYLVEDEDEMFAKAKEIIDKPFVFQEFIRSSYGKDIRLHVVGEKVVASMLRKSQEDFRANITSGGSMEAYEPTQEEQELAIKATKAIGADFAGVDILFGPNNEPILCEVNSNAHIRNMYECTGIDVADFMIDHIVQKLHKSSDFK